MTQPETGEFTPRRDKKRKGSSKVGTFKEPEYKTPVFKSGNSIGASVEEDDPGYVDPSLVEQDLGLEIKDIDSLEIAPLDDSIKKRSVMIGQEKFELLVFPRHLLQGKFTDRSGCLSLPLCLKSEWFSRTLKQHHFTSDWRFRKDESGRFLLPIPDEEAYGVWQRI